MSDKFERVARPSSASGFLEVSSPQGVNRSRLMFYMTIGAAVLSVASAAVGLYRFKDGEQGLVWAGTMKTTMETSKIEIDRDVSKVEAKWAERVKQLETKLLEKDSQLRDQQMRTEKTAQLKNLKEARLAEAQETNQQIETYKFHYLLEPALPMLRRSIMCSSGGGEPCGILSPPYNPRPLIQVHYPPGMPVNRTSSWLEPSDIPRGLPASLPGSSYWTPTDRAPKRPDIDQ